jgi:molybdenum cofactor cytidylyltransferase
LQVGLHEVLNRGRDAAIVTLVDRPPVRSSTLELLVSAFREALSQGKWALVPQFEDKHGHPVIISREMIEAFLKAPATSNAREIEHNNQQHIQYLQVNDSNVPLNVDTPEEYSRLTTE